MRSLDIIWAEDNPGDVWMIRHALADVAAVTLRLTTTADAAVALMAERRPDLLVLDTSVAMNRMAELCQPGVRVVVFTSGVVPKERERLSMLGANDVIEKPTKPESYLGLVLEIVDRCRASGDPASV